MNSINILSFFSTYPYEVFRRFLGSLYDTGFKGKTTFFMMQDTIDQLSNTLKSKFKKVEIKPFYELKIPCHLYTVRFFLYLKYLNSIQLNPNGYTLLCDGRDVLFQKNPEDYPLSDNDLFLFQEGNVLIKESKINYQWHEVLKKIFQHNINYSYRPVICAGTILIKNSYVIKFLETFIEYVINFKLCETGLNLDQGLCNYLYYANKLKCNSELMTNDDNFVNTTGFGVKKINKNSLIVNRKNEVSYIVHQYDRFTLEDRK
ncbi:uncharacterized protein METZ01_LOCUS417132, partial [marine metagenome]